MINSVSRKNIYQLLKHSVVFSALSASIVCNASAQTKGHYVAYTADTNGDGRPDIFVKATPTIVFVPLNADTNIPVPIKPSIPSFVLLSNGSGSYEIHTDINNIALSSQWTRTGVKILVNPTSNPAVPSIAINYSGGDQQAFTNSVPYTYEAQSCNNTGCSSSRFQVTVLTGLAQSSKLVEGYEYNALGRIIKVKRNGASKSQYYYDQAGNRQQVIE